jgi:hypothetical protein
MSTSNDTEMHDASSAALTHLQRSYNDRCAEIKLITEEGDRLLIENDILRTGKANPAQDD